MCQLEAKIEAKKYPKSFTSDAYDYLNQVPEDLEEPNKKWGNVICKYWTLELKVEFHKV